MKHRPYFKFPFIALCTLVTLYVGFTLASMIGAWNFDWNAQQKDQWAPRLLLFIFGPLIAGVLRVASFHPRTVSKYATWLSATPWRLGIHLPLAPVWLVWEDLVFLVPIALLAQKDAHIAGWIPVAGYVLSYTAMAIFTMNTPAAKWFSLALLFLISLPALWLANLAVISGVLIAMVVLARFALQMSLRSFPWDLADTMRDSKRNPRAGLAWPLNRIGPAQPPMPASDLVGFATAALFGWWVFVLLHVCYQTQIGEFIGTELLFEQLPIVCAFCAVVRLGKYCLHHWPPISTWGRLMTGRLIIPGYDYVMVSPILMIVLAFAMPHLLVTELPLPITAGLTVACVAALGYNGRPTLRSWQLTGHHRILSGGVREPAVPKARFSR